MEELTTSTANFLESAFDEDLSWLLSALLESPFGKVADLYDEDSGHRVLIKEVRPGVFVVIDIGKAVLFHLLRDGFTQMRSEIIENYGGYRLSRNWGFGDRLPAYDMPRVCARGCVGSCRAGPPPRGPKSPGGAMPLGCA